MVDVPPAGKVHFFVALATRAETIRGRQLLQLRELPHTQPVVWNSSQTN